MKKLTVLAIIMALICLIAMPVSASEQSETASTWTFTDDNTGMCFKMPSEWVLVTTSDANSSSFANEMLLRILLFTLVLTAIPVLTIISIIKAGKFSIKSDGTVTLEKTLIDKLTVAGIYLIAILLAFAITFAIAMWTLHVFDKSFILGFIPVSVIMFFLAKFLSKIYNKRKIKTISKFLKDKNCPSLLESRKNFIDPAIIGYCQVYFERGQRKTIEHYLKEQLKAKAITEEDYYILLVEFSSK